MHVPFFYDYIARIHVLFVYSTINIEGDSAEKFDRLPCHIYLLTHFNDHQSKDVFFFFLLLNTFRFIWCNHGLMYS